MFISTSINESPVIAAKAAAAITGGAMLAVAMGSSGVSVATAGAAAVGLLIAETEASVAAGDDVTVQIKDIGLWKVGASVTAGSLLASDANGKAVAATSGQFALAMALESATAAGAVIKVQIIKAYKPEASAEASVALGQLTDVDMTTAATDGQVLKYDGTASKWKPGDDATE